MARRRSQLAKWAESIAAMTPRTLGDALAQIGVVAAAWSRLSAYERRKVRTAAERLVGLVERRTDRRTGQAIGVYDATSGILDVDCVAEGDKYAVMCEAHGSLVHVSSLYAARSTGCLDFCDDCREMDR